MNNLCDEILIEKTLVLSGVTYLILAPNDELQKQFKSDVGKSDIYIWYNLNTACSVYLQFTIKFGLHN